MQTDRTIAGHRIGVDPIFDLVPAGGTPQIRQDVITEQCNSCHNPLIAHGNRREVRLCTLCHTAAAVDNNGTTIEFKNMIHKLHAGKDLPSIVNGPPGSQYKISNTVFAQKDQNGVITGIGFPRSLESCTICHSGGLTTNYYTDRPAASACATCHDDVNPSLETTAAGPPGTNHFQQKGFADGDCSFCHVPDSGKEFDISVVGAHTIPERSKQLAGLNAAITGGPPVWLIFLVGGVIGALLVAAVFDLALVLLSSLAGAALVAQAVTLPAGVELAVFLVLVALGIIIQTRLFRGRR
jgi:OmcA/MtrC family decaheme c-type cytochrome